MHHRLRIALLLAPIALDCAANWLVGGSIHRTLSAEAWNHREHEHWGWCWQFIDALFAEGHCREAAASEERHGGVWKAIAATWRGTS